MLGEMTHSLHLDGINPSPLACPPCAFDRQSRARPALGSRLRQLSLLWGQGLFVSCPVCLGRQRPPLESGAPPQGPGPLPAERGAGLDRISGTAFRGPGAGSGSRSECDALQPGRVPGVRKLGPGFLLLFSAHTAAAFT